MTVADRDFAWREGGDLALLQAPFRPFFLVAALWAPLAILLWVHALRSGIGLAPPYGGLVWHAHTMVYGFGAAVVAGFLFTAVPSWTGQARLLGRGLAGACLVWIAGRLAMAASGEIGAPLAAAVDLAFLALVSGRTLWQVLAARNWRNIPIGLAPLVLLLGNALVHAEALGVATTATFGNRLGVCVIVMLVGMIGGRIIPAFTRNWLNNTGRGGPLPVGFNRFDSAVLLLTVLSFGAWLAAPVTPATAAFAGLAAVAHAVRLARWRGWRTGHDPLVWVLHLGYAWLPVSFALLAASAVVPQAVPASAALHALTAGVMATMMLAMMTRATLGHTGRQLTASRGTTGIYLLVTASAVTRVAASLLASSYLPLLIASAVLWVAAFLLYLLLYSPMLCGARVTPDSPPGA